MSPRPLPPPAENEPLTPDERQWAERLALVGPHGGPPPALDARILAAAHAAVARQPGPHASRRRWPTLIGAAASLVIVVGLAWQLQPLLRSRPSLGEGPVAAAPIPRSEGSLSADVLAAADPVAKRAVDSRPSSPPPAAPPRKPASPPPAVATTVPAPPAAAQRPSAFGDDAIPPYADYTGTAAARQAAPRAAANEAGTRAATDERRERAAASAPQPFPAGREAATGAALPAVPPPAASSARRAFAPVQDAPATATGASTPQPEAEAKAAIEHDNDTLDRVGMGGARSTPTDLPVTDDARLEPTAWLQRIRDRRDADDVDGALESLALFRKSHPRIRLPDDLARLDR